MEYCPRCNNEMETSGPYARCLNCDCLYVSINGCMRDYPVIAPMRRLIESVLGFDPPNPDSVQRTGQ